MRFKKVLALAAMSATALVLGSANIASAGSPWTHFGPGTGIQQVTYNGVPSAFSRGGSGVVEQWLAPTTGNHGYYYQYKPMSSVALGVTTPFKQSCDNGLTALGGLNPWPYQSGVYTPAGVLDPFFPINGLTYWVCVGPASNYATASFSYTVGDPSLTRHGTFDVQMAGPGFTASGSFNYSDTNGTSYTVNVTDVLVTPTTVTFSGPYTGGGFLEGQAVIGAGGTISSWGADVVSSDPAGTLGTFIPTTMGVNPSGAMFIYTR